MLHPDNRSVESWKAEGSGEKMCADFADFEPWYTTDYTSDCLEV